MRADKADALHAIHGRNGFEQIRKSVFRIAIRVDGLAKECDLTRTFFNTIANFTQNLFHGMVDFAPSNVWNDAIGAGIIASPHDCLLYTSPSPRDRQKS